MKNLLLVVAGVALIIVLAATMGLFESSPTDSTPSEVAAVPQVAPEEEGASPSESEEMTSPESEAPEDESKREEIPAEEQAPSDQDDEDLEPLATWDEAESQWLEVSVILPPDSPPDASLIVLALDRALSRSELYGRRGIVPERQRLERDTNYRGLLAVAPIDATGVGRIAFPPDVETPHIAISGRYLYSSEARQVDFAAGRIELRPELGAWITGKLLPPSGVEGEWEEVEVRIATDISARISMGTNSGGFINYRGDYEIGEEYDFRAVPMNTDFMMGAVSDEFALNMEEGKSGEPGEHLVIDLQLSMGGLVRGRVLDEEGQPVEGADVEAKTREIFGDLAFDLREDETDADGNYELKGVKSGEAWLLVEHEEYRAFKSESSFDVAEGEEFNYADIKLDSGASIAGTVMFPDGTLAVGTELDINVDFSANVSGLPMNPLDFSGAGRNVVADDKGEFSFNGLSVGPYQVSAEVDGSGFENQKDGSWRGQLTNLLPYEDVAANTQLLLVLEAPQSISGIVLDTTGQPVSEFTVEASLAAAVWYLPPAATESDSFVTEDGTFVLDDLRSGKWVVVAKAEGFASSTAADISLPSDEKLEFRLSRPASISGMVFDTDNNPVAGARVSPELDLQQMVMRQQGRLNNFLTATTNEAGFFSMDEVAPGTGTIVAAKDAWASSEVFAYELEEGEALGDVVLVLRMGGTITGVLFDDEGEPKAGADIFIQQPTGLKRRTTRTDENGEFREEHLDPATWQVMALNLTSESGEFDQAEMLQSMKISMVELKDGAEEHVILGALPENPVMVKGKVTANGDPVEQSMISFVPASGGGMEKLKIATTNDDGEYLVELSEPGDYLVTVQSMGVIGRQDSLEYRRRIPESESFEVNFELPVGRISGTVYGADGEPLADARVTLNRDGGTEFGTMFGGRYSESRSDESGDFELKYLQSGAYLVAAGGGVLGGIFGDNADSGGRIVSRVEIREGQWVRGLDFHLEESGSISGVAVDHAGAPVEGAVLFARDENGNLLETFSFLKSDAGGRYKYEQLAPGSYTLSARKGHLASSETELIRVRSGEKTEFEIVMDPGTILKVALQDKSGELVASVISVTDPQGREMNGMLDLEQLMAKYSGGVNLPEQEIGPLPPGTYSIRAEAEDGRSTKKNVTLTGQAERKVRLRLK